MGQTTAAVRATKKFPGGGTVLGEKCTKCGATYGEHDGQRCPPVTPETYNARPRPIDDPAQNPEVTVHSLGSVPTSAPARFELIELLKLEESPLNPRKTFDKAKHDELTASVAAKGVLEPLLVRPFSVLGKSTGRYEVVAGTRRKLAAEAAKLKEVPCLVRELDDAEVIEIGVVENAQRHDLTPLQEGDAYRLLIEQHGRTVEQLVEKTGRSRTIIFQRLKLAELEGPIRARLEQGKLTPSVAELIARLPTQSMREAALQTLEEKAHWRNKGEEGDLSGVPFRDAKEILDAEVRLVLREATFDVKDAELVPGVGACGACPKRTHASKDLFPGIKEDHCLDSVCWKKKGAASTRLLKEEVRERGKELVKINRLNDQYSSDKLAKPVAEKFSRTTDKIDGKHTWKDLLGGLDGAAVVALDSNNKTHNLVDKKKALALLEAKDPKKAEAVKKALETPTEEDGWEARNAELRRKNEARRTARQVLQAKALKVITKQDVVVNLLIAAVACNSWGWDALLRHAGLSPKTKPEALKPPEKLRVLLAHAFDINGDGGHALVALAEKATKLDLKKLEKQALAAEPGKCFVCGKDPGPKTLCDSCGGAQAED